MAGIRFKGISELRAIAATSVVFHHVEQYKYRAGMSSMFEGTLGQFFRDLGKNGVHMFFVLSGFLITYLLLAEKLKFDRIDIKKFYMRRVLRIWPLYYVVLILSLTLFPALINLFQIEHQWFFSWVVFDVSELSIAVLALYVFFLPNVAVYYNKLITGITQGWSIGVEEQFYAIWPWLIQKVNQRTIIVVLLFTALVYPLIPKLLSYIDTNASQNFLDVIHLFPIHYMSFGALGALYKFNKLDHKYRLTKSSVAYVLAFLSTLVFLVIKSHPLILAVLFTFLLLFIIEDDFKFNLRSRFLSSVGEVS